MIHLLFPIVQGFIPLLIKFYIALAANCCIFLRVHMNSVLYGNKITVRLFTPVKISNTHWWFRRYTGRSLYTPGNKWRSAARVMAGIVLVHVRWSMKLCLQKPSVVAVVFKNVCWQYKSILKQVKRTWIVTHLAFCNQSYYTYTMILSFLMGNYSLLLTLGRTIAYMKG